MVDCTYPIVQAGKNVKHMDRFKDAYHVNKSNNDYTISFNSGVLTMMQMALWSTTVYKPPATKEAKDYFIKERAEYDEEICIKYIDEDELNDDDTEYTVALLEKQELDNTTKGQWKQLSWCRVAWDLPCRTISVVDWWSRSDVD